MKPLKKIKMTKFTEQAMGDNWTFKKKLRRWLLLNINRRIKNHITHRKEYREIIEAYNDLPF